MKNLIILGSTGSIGTQTLQIVKENPKEFKIVALSCNSNVELLKQQIKEVKPEIVAVYDEEMDRALNKIVIAFVVGQGEVIHVRLRVVCVPIMVAQSRVETVRRRTCAVRSFIRINIF